MSAQTTMTINTNNTNGQNVPRTVLRLSSQPMRGSPPMRLTSQPMQRSQQQMNETLDNIGALVGDLSDRLKEVSKTQSTHGHLIQEHSYGLQEHADMISDVSNQLNGVQQTQKTHDFRIKKIHLEVQKHYAYIETLYEAQEKLKKNIDTLSAQGRKVRKEINTAMTINNAEMHAALKITGEKCIGELEALHEQQRMLDEQMQQAHASLECNSSLLMNPVCNTGLSE